MVRAKRCYTPGLVWHLTHRCHKKEFLLKFSKDRDRYLKLLYHAKKHFKFHVLDYIITSNHIHLLVYDLGKKNIIPDSMQYIAGRSGQEYNNRKNRRGAFWDDRYHATAIQSGPHLVQCMMYIALNMVRTGVVKHPREWAWTGYHEILNPKQRYSIVDHANMQKLFCAGTLSEFQDSYKEWIESGLTGFGYLEKDSRWSKSVAVGTKDYVRSIKDRLGKRASGREVSEPDDGKYYLKEPGVEYELQNENAIYWDR